MKRRQNQNQAADRQEYTRHRGDVPRTAEPGVLAATVDTDRPGNVAHRYLVGQLL